MDLVKKFGEVGIKDVLSVGGKNASLGEMLQQLSIRKINDPEKVIQLILKAIKEAGYEPGKDIFISLDSAASSFYENGKYKMGIGEYTSSEMIDYYENLIKKYPIISIEDGLAEDDWSGWQLMQKRLGSKITLIGDDLFVTNTKLLKKGIDLKAANSILIKPNQIGTLSAAIEAIKLAKDNKFSWVVSHRSGETLDTTIADIAYSTTAFGLKTGSPHQSPDCKEEEDVRRVKYLRMDYMEKRDQFKKKKLPMGLIILDGWGLRAETKGNAIKLANTPNFDYLWNNFKHTELKASGLDVGLPQGEMGNSEVGHLNIGAGRIVEQEVVRIDNSIDNGSFFENKTLLNAFSYAKKNNSKVHIMGLVSKAVVHSSLEHLLALLALASEQDFPNVLIHTITDGRDSSPTSAKDWISKIEEKIKETKVGRIATICGRYYAMDRDKRWDRTQLYYNLLTKGEGKIVKNWKEGIDTAYKSKLTDEFIKPIVVGDDTEEVLIEDNDVVIFYNFRADRTRQITRAFMEDNFKEFNTKKIDGLKWICFTEYDETFNNNKNISVVFPKVKIENTLADILSKNGLRQLKIAETEKYAHVTYFFNGGDEKILRNETRILVDSPRDISTYDQKPEMAANTVTEKLIQAMPNQDFFVLNFANPDMVGHTGNLPATIEAVETVDRNLGKIIAKAKELGYTLLVMADHGNAEEEDEKELNRLTSHSTNPVPLILADFYNKFVNVELAEQGRLSDVAPTVLDLLEIEKPVNMTANSLIKRTVNKNNYLIQHIEAYETFDSRNKSTIKARIILDDGSIGDWAMVPAGKSTGKGEAPVVSTDQALINIKEIEKVLNQQMINVFDQKTIDQILMENLNRWGGNTTLAVSLAMAKVSAKKKNQELYEYIEEVYDYNNRKTDRVAMFMNIFNGGLHALRGDEKLGIDKPAIQEFMIYVKDKNYKLAIDKADNIYWKLKEILFNEGFDNQHFGDEGGYSPQVIKGLTIPDGFATTSEAYFYFLKETGIENKIKSIIDKIKVNDIKDLQKKSKELQTLILKTDFPKILKDEIIKNYKWLQNKYKDNNLAVAVRSSATAEDSASASFAGQHESFLNVSGEKNLIEAIKHCIASLFTERAIAYRDNLKMKYSDVALSVGVQKMVRSDLACSGVIFSCDTETGFPDVVLINSSYGLGENIVKGRVESDQFYVFEKTLAKGYIPILERRIGRKELTMVYGEKVNEVKNLKTPVEKQLKLTLSDDEVLELARYSLMIENHYQRPMDIEWAKDGKDKKLYIVQARPETVQSQRNVQFLEEYVFDQNNKRKEIVVGLSVGNKIGKGKASVIKNIKDIAKFKKGDVLITHMTDPDWVPIMRMASAIVTESGSRTCHAAIVGRELGLPTIVGAYNATKLVKDKQIVTVVCSEGEKGVVYDGNLNFTVKRTDLSKLSKPKVKITMNIGDPNQAFLNSFIPNDGVGLAREEFIVANHIKVHPMALIEYKKQANKTKKQIDDITFGYSDKTRFYVDKLADGIGKIASAFYPKEVILRFSDFKTNEYKNLIGGANYELSEENPMIGFRGASRYYHQSFKPAFDLELKAIKKVVNDFGLTNLSLMVPFCRTVSEGEKVIKLIKSAGIENQKIYVMCEIPSNVILADKFLDVFDGMSIGSNDLTQLTLGIDRDANHLIQNIANENDDSVKELICQVIKKCKARNKYIGICGQAPSDYPKFAQFLIENGIDSISLNPDSVLKIRKALE